MEDTLRLLYQLQRVDNKLDDVNESKGDLPSSVASLQDKLDQLSTLLKEKQQYIDQSVADRNKADGDIKDFEEKLKKYKDQQYQVRNNKEYDAITKEIDFAQESIKTLTKQFEDFENQMSIAKNELKEFQENYDQLKAELDEKKSELAIVSKETEQEELTYTHEREKLLVRIPKQYINRYTMIRNARGRVSVAIVRKNSCSGCGNRIPPQHIMEIRKNDKLYLCQHCGRIIVSDEIAEQHKDL